MLKTTLRLIASSTFAVISMLACGLAAGAGTPVFAEDTYSKIPVIVEDPQSATVKVGADAFFSVKAKGQNLSYQWYLNDTHQKGINSETVKIPNVKSDYNGTRIYVVVSNAYGAATSKEAVLTVDSSSTPAPNQPGSPVVSVFRTVPQTINVGQRTKLEAVYTGGQGIITPGYVILDSNHYIEIAPDRTTTYNLIVTASNGKQTVASTTVNVRSRNEDTPEEPTLLSCGENNAAREF